MNIFIAIAGILSATNSLGSELVSKHAELPTFLLLGQSNMVGMRSEATALPAEMKSINPNALFFKNGAWVGVEPGNTEPKGYGPEISFSNSTAYQGSQIGIIKISAGDTSLAAAWNPSIPGQMYQSTVDAIRSASATRPIRIVGVLWMQGESDGATVEMAQQYKSNLLSLISKLREDTSNPHLAFITARETAPSSLYPYTEMVRQAQVSIDDENYRWFSCDDLPKVADGLHYDSQGQILLGQRFAQAVISLGLLQ